MSSPGVASPERIAELSANLAEVRARIAVAATEAGRDPASITLIVVTKTWPAADVRALADLGVRDVGENRDQDAAAKAIDCADLALRWHFIGQLQTNKARSVARYATAVHSVDRLSLVQSLSAGAVRAGRTLEVLLQCDLAPPETQPPENQEPGNQGSAGAATGSGRGGTPVEATPALLLLAEAVQAANGLQLRGVMGVAPLGGDADIAFARLAHAGRLVASAHPGADWISAGMSGDLVEAISHGATHVRVGTAVLGHRPPLG